ncbi:hypothetical protein B296_00045701 [Ensete ventricosum]|uniref:Uncharacterized protein n=1 Tax=Ensete ventricosum TaxID=4639 RepID=A0A426YID6_ENSVE|nr:hypothetical protein B296_00045701 [Ensete ventricosum]
MVIQFAEAKLGLEGLSTGQEDVEVGTLEEYATVLPFEYDQSGGELDCSDAYIRLREPSKSEDKTEQANVATKEDKENRIGASPATGCRRPYMGLQSVFPSTKGNCSENTGMLKQAVKRGDEATTSPEGLNYPNRWRCKATDSRAMGLAAPWYRRGGTSMESSIPCSHGGRALVVKGAEEVENAEANSKYQDKAEGQRPENFIRPVSTGFSSR